ncbi:Coenzyme F420 hydrogenase/dehydrogenase, beta subunit C-terminal domain [Bacteroides clarus]|uniref:Coenzyme F420 hydrogenase/dehydrogenase, beta subunit C-terminal domain n=1 Tax=Bacteroides clarus TaxID=626929 RepID=UPI0024B04F85|nr:Coenzyme F420 hydrogenase/dehydrogenase, beta subunit C-terminal domain [Bacteroides clarus]
MNINTIHNCFGCGVCSIVCSKQIIDIRLNEDGFYEPQISELEKCTDCGLCFDVCAFSHEDYALKEPEIKSYAAWSKDNIIRNKCSSGGIGFELARTLLKDNFKVCGVRYVPEKKQAEHYIATTEQELIPSIGSKYIQSYTVNGFKAINRKDKYLVTGTPCQIDSFRRYIQLYRIENHFILIDFFCHGIPSKLMWDKYIHQVEKEVGNILHVSWRDKRMGWHDSWAMHIDGAKSQKFSRHSQGDIFFRLFLSDTCLGKACYTHCRFKHKHSSADIRIGDFLGKAYHDNDKGVSTAIAFTTEGDKLLHRCHCELIPHSFEIVAENQMETSPAIPRLTSTIMQAIKNPNYSIEYIFQIFNKEYKKENYIYLLKHPLIALKRICKKIQK